MVIFIQLIVTENQYIYSFCHCQLYKCYHFINSVTTAYIIRDSMTVMCKHQNVGEWFKKRILLILIVHLFDNYNKTLQNARYIHHDNVFLS